MTQKIIYTGEDFPEFDFRTEAVNWFNSKRKDVYSHDLSVAEYCFNQTKEYNKGYNGDNCEVGYKLHKVSGLCHSTFSKASDKTTSFIVNLFTRNLHQSVDRPFLEYILSPTQSPWRSVLQDLYVIRDKDNDSYPIGYIFEDISKHHLHVVSNFIIAGRLVSAWTQGVISDYLIKQGFTMAEALVLGPNFYCASHALKGEDINYTDVDIFAHAGTLHDPREVWRNRYYYSTSCRGYVSGDMPFNQCIDPWKVLNAQPVVNTGKDNFAEGGTPNPCNYIWGKPTKNVTFDVWDLIGFDERKFKDINPMTVSIIKSLLNSKNYEGQITLK